MKTDEIIDGYLIIRYIGAGGMGTVYEVQKESVNYALKLCTDTDEESIKRFRREVRLMRSIKDENVIEIINNGLDNDPPYFTMPLCELSLKDAVTAKLTIEQQFEYSRQLCLGVKKIHDEGMIHRDIKPANILISKGVVKVSDLGLGKFIERDSTILTPTHDTTIGTLDYVAPEISDKGQGRDADVRSDIYSIGRLLYYVFSDGNNPRYIDPTKIGADIYSIITKCTKISPNDRYQDVVEVISALDVCQKSRNALLSISDVVSVYRAGGSSTDFADITYRHLLTLQDDLGVLIKDLRTIGPDNFKLIVKHKKEEVSNLINLLLTTYRNEESYWIQFDDVELLVSRARTLMQESQLTQEKQELIEFAINISLNYNRYPAMEIVGYMLNDLDEDEMKSMSVFFSANKDNINQIKDNFRHPIPDIVRLFLR